jgi:hypothetical protein
MATRINQHIHDFCEDDFAKWLVSRGRFISSYQQNILAQFMPSKSGIERDYPNSSLCNAFNLHLQLKLGSPKDEVDAMCFLFVYFKKWKPKSLKAYIHDDLKDSITMKTAIEKAHRVAETIYRSAQLTEKVNRMMNDKNFAW